MNTIEFEVNHYGRKIHIPRKYQRELKEGRLKVTVICEPIEDENKDSICELRKVGKENIFCEIPKTGQKKKKRRITDEEKETVPLIDLAIKILNLDKQVSVSYLQRNLRIGYNRAKSLVEELDERGLIEPPGENNKRKIIK